MTVFAVIFVRWMFSDELAAWATSRRSKQNGRNRVSALRGYFIEASVDLAV